MVSHSPLKRKVGIPMNIVGESKYIGSKTGVNKKTGEIWYSAKFIDESSYSIFTCFVDKSIYDVLSTCHKYSPVALNLTLTPGKKAGSGYFRIESVEIIE